MAARLIQWSGRRGRRVRACAHGKCRRSLRCLRCQRSFDVALRGGFCATGVLYVAMASRRFATLAGLVLLLCLLHLLLWNPLLVEPMRRLTGGLDARWQSVALLFGLVMSAYAALIRWLHPPDVADPGLTSKAWPANLVVREQSISCGVALVMAAIGIVWWVPQHTGVASAFAFAVVLSSLLIAWAYRHEISASGFSLATAFGVCICMAELALDRGWVVDSISTRHVVIQICNLAVWVVAWTLFANYAARWSQTNWLLLEKPRVERRVIYFLVAGLVLILVAGLAPLVQDELAADFSPNESMPVWLPGLLNVLCLAIGGVFLATVIVLLSKPHLPCAAMLVVLWLCAWSALAIPCESTKSVASALRWLLPLGGFALAVLIASRHWFERPWSVVRASLGFTDVPIWKRDDTQQLINLSLALVVIIVLTISTLNAAVFMLKGGAGFGGPLAESILSRQRMLAEVSFGVPIAMIVGTFLFYATREKRSWLATCGSGVFQYLVVMAIVLLYLSPNPALATKRFLNIVQAVSIGMSLYGLVWFYFRERIGVGHCCKTPGDRSWICIPA